MKTFIFSALALGMMASCANTDVEGVVDNGEPVAITLNTGVQANVVAGVTRAPIADGNFEATILGWESAGNSAPDYSTATTTWETSSTIDASKKTTITLDKYYNINSTTNTFMKACYPAGSVNGGVYGFTDAKEDGSVDILYAKEISGSRTTAPSKGLEFNHMLTQIKFSIQAGDGLPAGTKLKSITLNDSKIATGINLGTDALETKAPTNPITVPGITPATGIVIPDAATLIQNSELMIAPTEGNTMELTVVTNDGVNDKTFDKVTVTTKDASFAAGTAYTVTLTFKEKISVNATVSAWKDSTATGEVEQK